MNKLCYLLIIFFTSEFCSAQNLVPNPSFENYGSLPCSWITSQSGFSNAMQNWVLPTEGSTDVISTLVPQTCYANCFSTNSSGIGHQAPRSGDVVTALVTYGQGCNQPNNYREYLEVQLVTPLIPGYKYYAEMYVSFADFSYYASNNIGMYFSDTFINLPSQCTQLNFVPQINESAIITDTVNWTLISDTIIATSPADYLIIGNFYNDNNTTNLFFGGGSSNLDARYYIDDVSVVNISLSGIIETAQNSMNINIFPIPFTNQLSVTIDNNQLYQIILYDITSRNILKQSFTKSISLNTEQLTKGIYLYEVRNKEGIVKKGKVVKD